MAAVSTAERFVGVALGEVGKPYETHRDCSGFVAWAGRQVGISLPEGSVAQWRVGQPIDVNQSRPGDLHFWDTIGEAPGHVAIDVGGGLVVHAFNEQRGIITTSLGANMGGPYMGARRIFTDGQPTDAKAPTGKDPALQYGDSNRHERRRGKKLTRRRRGRP